MSAKVSTDSVRMQESSSALQKPARAAFFDLGQCVEPERPIRPWRGIGDIFSA